MYLLSFILYLDDQLQTLVTIHQFTMEAVTQYSTEKASHSLSLNIVAVELPFGVTGVCFFLRMIVLFHLMNLMWPGGV